MRWVTYHILKLNDSKSWTNIYPIKNVETDTLKLKNFISDNLDIICEFINKDIELKKIIFQLPDIIKQAVSYYNLSI